MIIHTTEPVSRDHILRREWGPRKNIFPVQLTTSMVDDHTRLIHTLLEVLTICTCIDVTLLNTPCIVAFQHINIGHVNTFWWEVLRRFAEYKMVLSIGPHFNSSQHYVLLHYLFAYCGTNIVLFSTSKVFCPTLDIGFDNVNVLRTAIRIGSNNNANVLLGDCCSRRSDFKLSDNANVLLGDSCSRRSGIKLTVPRL